MLLPLSFGCGVGNEFYHALLTLIRVSFTIRSEFGGEKKGKKMWDGGGKGVDGWEGFILLVLWDRWMGG